jgi:3-oxoacyl-[acyl-carrier-protein] synthase II
MTQKSAKRRRVVVTGIGAVTPLGNTMDATWAGMIEGQSTAGPVRRFDASGFPTTIAYEVKDFQKLEGDWPFLNAAAHFGINAAHEALAQAKLGQGVDPMRIAACIGNGMGSPDFDWYERHYLTDELDAETLRQHAKYFPEMLTATIAQLANARAGVTTVHTACASSGQALGEAYEMIRYGDADVCVTGGADSMVNPYYFAGFSLLGALSKRNGDPATASRPFDKDRDGFVLGEGACILVFEELEHALARGATPLAEVCGYGVTESAYRITDLHPEGTGPIEAMQMALDDAGIDASRVGYINAHGTSTLLNDRIEALAVSKVFPKERCRTAVSSTKSMTGHMISAAGAIEFAVCVKALQHQVLPPSVNVSTQDPEVLATLTPATPTDCKLDYALSNSVGFGGSNTALVAGRMVK